LQIYFIVARFCTFQKLFDKIKAKELLKQGSKVASSAGLSMGFSLRMGFEKKIFWERGLPYIEQNRRISNISGRVTLPHPLSRLLTLTIYSV
jgi:hypothetical protein